eukprot:TRINITY_DN23266_c0_g1_i1.p1 TRINITY_DN23266_c0_g1~~TRINITY_DN23266_c0_g1_i1.p1  ORF type:complete len:390 (-),score=99.08 TRINITY_DN23266_c0_g1_i1:23-1192(-)
MSRNFESSIWEALAMGKEKFLSRVDTSGFNWKATHPHFGSAIHAILFGRIDEKADEAEEPDADAEEDEDRKDGLSGYNDIITDPGEHIQQRLRLLQIAMQRGADPYVVAPRTCDACRLFNSGEEDNKKTEHVTFANKSALECLWSVERVVKRLNSEDWLTELSNIDRAVEILTTSYSRRQTVPVPEELLETWERVHSDMHSPDVVFRVGPESEEVLAHRSVLCAASSVLRAMLHSEMREGARKEVRVEDASTLAVRIVISLLYAGFMPETEEEPGVPVLVEALALGHRWQLLYVVNMLVADVTKNLNLQTVEIALDVALHLQLPDLLSACRDFIIAHSREVKQKLAGKKGGAGFQIAAVRAEISRLLNENGEAISGSAYGETKKRRRMF